MYHRHQKHYHAPYLMFGRRRLSPLQPTSILLNSYVEGYCDYQQYVSSPTIFGLGLMKFQLFHGNGIRNTTELWPCYHESVNITGYCIYQLGYVWHFWENSLCCILKNSDAVEISRLYIYDTICANSIGWGVRRKRPGLFQNCSRHQPSEQLLKRNRRVWYFLCQD